MATTTINIRIDSDIKPQFEEFCKNIGMSMSGAFNVFAHQAVREQKIPFNITAGDRFYSAHNIEALEKLVSDVKSGDARLTEHELIEID